MDWLTKHQSVNNGLNGLRFVGCMLGVIGMCCSTSALADPLSGLVEDSESLSLIGNQTTGNQAKSMTDIDLSVISGKGGIAANLGDNERLAVILWDERGGGNPRTTNNEVGERQGFQNVNLTINQR
ncbi:MAG: hypothetical protein Q7U70_11035 [Methylotenera sp.]|nr:hypothetical protein [Methylotenera sp.]MDO9233332.1 hypothetical protein [Methylotenera sp.]MDO9389763.1 hypothetical protein [Methylotenera sp.]MDP2403059.1 hypothetical protein [Methylotenera sp.]MDZ4223017.1 hypothetical protein [Methylotenera sp.]